jgi:hypothetical protein
VIRTGQTDKSVVKLTFAKRAQLARERGAPGALEFVARNRDVGDREVEPRDAAALDAIR